MKYKKKPVVIDAIQWTGDNEVDIVEFMPIDFSFSYRTESPVVIIPTLEGDMTASVGDYIIRGISGEFYPCRSKEFWLTYDKVEEND